MFDNTDAQVFSEPSVILQDERRINWFWEFNDVFDSDLSAYAKLVRLYLARCANKNRQAWPSLNTIAKNCGISRPTAKRAVSELVEKGWIKKYVRRRETLEFETTVYALMDVPQNSGGPQNNDGGRVTQTPPGKTGGRVYQNPPINNEQGRFSQSLPVKSEQGGVCENLPPQKAETTGVSGDQDDFGNPGVGSERPQVGSDRPYVGSEVYNNNNHRTIHNEKYKKNISSLREDGGLPKRTPTREKNEHNIDPFGGGLFKELFSVQLPENGQKKTPPGKKNKKDSDSRVKKAIENHCELFFSKFGQKYVANFAKDGKQFKNLLKFLDSEFPDDPESALSELFLLQERFFKSNDAWITSSGYTVGAFIAVINKLRVRPQAKLSRAFTSLDQWARERSETEGDVSLDL